MKKIQFNGKHQLLLKFKYKFIIVLSLCCFGCSSFTVYNAATGRNEFIAIPTQEEVTMGSSVHKDIEQKYKLITQGNDWERVNRIGKNLALVSDRQDIEHQFFIIDQDEINAFTIPGGHVYFYKGLYDRLKTDDQIAAVLAHEIGHGAARHAIKKFQAAMGYNLIGNIILSQLDLENFQKQVATLSSGVIMNLVFSAYSRQDEYEADRLGIKYMYLAGYDLKGMIETLKVLELENKGGGAPLILRTHPYVSDRIVQAGNEIKKIRSMYGDGAN